MESESQTPDNKVFIGGLLPTTTRESLMQHMSVFGELSECKIVLDKQTGLSKGYGFVRHHCCFANRLRWFTQQITQQRLLLLKASFS